MRLQSLSATTLTQRYVSSLSPVLETRLTLVSKRCLNCVQDDLEADPILEESRMLAENDKSAIYGSTATVSTYYG